MKKPPLAISAFALAMLVTAACDAPGGAPEDPADNQSVTDDFTSEQQVIEDPMAGDVVVEESPELGSGSQEEVGDRDSLVSSVDEAKGGEKAE